MAEEDNVIIAKFCDGANRTMTKAKWRYDYGQILKFEGLDLPETYQVHVSNDEFGIADIYLGNADGIQIPYKYFYTGLPIYAWVFLSVGENDGETKYLATIPIMDRAYPYTDPPTEEEYQAIQQLIAQMDTAVQAAEDAADKSERYASVGSYLVAEIDQRGHLIITRTDPIGVDFSLDSNGHLVMEVPVYE